jgi:hypothetical protein
MVESKGQSISLNGLTWSKTVMLCAILLCGAVAAYAGASVSISISIEERFRSIENRLDTPVNSSLSGLQKPFDYIISPVDAYYCLQNGTDGKLNWFSTNKTAVEVAAVGNLTSGGTILLKGCTLAATVTYGANILILEDYQGTRNYYGSNSFFFNGYNRTDVLANPYQLVAYVVDFDGTTVKVKNCSTGQVAYQTTNQTLAVQYAFSHLNNGSKGTEKVVLRGNFTLNYYPNVPPYADIEVQGYLNAVSKAAFMICFDDTLYIQYSTYFKNLTSIWGFRGSEGVVSRWVEQAGPTNTSYITLANLKEMRDAGWSFYSHGYLSKDMSAATITLADQDQEYRQSKDWIERNLNVRIDMMGFPSAKPANFEMVRQYYNYIGWSNYKSWPNYTWNYISDIFSCYFPTETSFNGTKADGGAIAAAAWYAVNSTGSGSNGELAFLTFHGTMTSYWFNQCMGNMSSWGLPVLTWRDINYYLNLQVKQRVAGADIKLENMGNQTSCINGTWIKHNIGFSPNVTFAKIAGSAYINSTAFLIEPTILTMNTTHFQIDFCINNAGTITPVAAADARTLYWYALYQKRIDYPQLT